MGRLAYAPKVEGAAAELDWVKDVTEDVLKTLTTREARTVRLLKLFVAVGKAVAPAAPRKRGNGPIRRRSAGGRGARRGNAKLDGAGAAWIKAWAAAGCTQRAIAEAFNVSQPVVSGIVNGRRWRRS